MAVTVADPSGKMVKSVTSVPIVDFGQLKDERTKGETLKDLREAIFSIGFLYLVNTGLEVWHTTPIQKQLVIC